MNKLKELRDDRGLSQLELARRSRMAPGDICRIEKGAIPAYPAWRKRLAKALHVSQEELFPEDGKQ